MKAVVAPIIQYPFAAGNTFSRVLEAGDEGRPDVLFVHGAGARADRWRDNIGVIAAAGYHCFAIDLPGHGLAEKGRSFPYGVPGYADFIEAFLDDRGLAAAHLVGTSLGAHCLSEVALRRPQSVASLTLVGATGLFPIGEETRARIAASISDQSAAGIERKLASVFLDYGRHDVQFLVEEWRINNSAGAAEAFAGLAEYFRRRLDQDVVGERLVALVGRFPLRIFWGAQDRTVPIESGRRASELLGCTLVEVPDAAHAPYMENPDFFNDRLLQFLASIVDG